MLRFDQLLSTAPTIAAPVRDRLQRAGIGLLGTLRADGWPRVSPIEVSFVEGGLYMGMMPGSRKCVDVRRDPRVTLLTAIADRQDLSGEGKLVGHVVELDRSDAERMLRMVADASGLDADALAGSPMFELLIGEAAWQHVDGDSWLTLSWRATDPSVIRRRARHGATGAAADVPG
jgi:hypothetical protein